MKLKARVGLFLFGVGVVLYGSGLMHRGVMIFRNVYRADMYSAGIAATGVFISLLAFLPPASWVSRWTSHTKTKGAHRHEHLNHPIHPDPTHK